MRHRQIASLLFSVTMVAAAPAAVASDLAVPAAPRAAYDWGGFYAGVNLGYGVANDPSVYAIAGPITTFQSETYKIVPSGITGGGQAGYNFQTGSWLAGLEADFQGAGQSDAACISNCFNNGGIFSGTASQRLSWFGTVRGRVGVIADRVLFYLTGGLAYGRVQTSATAVDTFLPPAAHRAPALPPLKPDRYSAAA